MRIAQEEVFGPVLSVIKFKDEEEAVRIANDIAYGLGAGVWTQSVKRATSMAETHPAGTVWVNTYRAVSFLMPFGGYKASGLGRENGAEAIEGYLQTKSVWINNGPGGGNPFIMKTSCLTLSSRPSSRRYPDVRRTSAPAAMRCASPPIHAPDARMTVTATREPRVTFDSVGIIGGGAWGTALAQTLRLAGRDVRAVGARGRRSSAEINAGHANSRVPAGRHARCRPAGHRRACRHRRAGCRADGGAGPARARRRPASWRAHLPAGKPVVICAKGLEQATGKLLGEVLAETMPARDARPCCRGRASPPTWRAACPPPSRSPPPTRRWARRWPPRSATAHLRIYWSSDTIGVQLGGAVKNVLAIAAGIVDGKGLGASAHAALVTRGFAELRRFGEALGARPETLMGLSGLGDLLLTCGSPQSRNMSLGRALGQGQTLAVRARQPALGGGGRLSPRRPSSAWPPRRASTCRSARPCTPSSRAGSPSMPPSRPCCRGRSGRKDRLNGKCRLGRASAMTQHQPRSRLVLGLRFA